MQCFLYDQGLISGLSYDSAELNFEMCDLEEEPRHTDLYGALEELALGAQFAFYNLSMAWEVQKLLSGLKIEAFNNEVLYLSQIENFQQGLFLILSGMTTSDIAVYKLTRLVIKITSDIASIADATDAEVIIRTRGHYHGEICKYWHIDKSRNQSLRELSSAENRNYGQQVFLVPLVGEGTVYQSVNNAQKDRFFTLANETMFYYGYNAENDCTEDDSITKLFASNEERVVPYGYGAVHVTGKNGTIHREPDKSDFGRIILIITPIY